MDKLIKKIKDQFQTLYNSIIPMPSFGILPFIFITGFIIFYFIFTIFLGSPIIGSDEYMYFIFGKFFKSHTELLALDPGLQPITNYIYFSMIFLLSKLGFADLTLAGRILHIFEYCLAAFFTYKVFFKICDQRYLLLGLAGMLLLPHACYSLVIMPEIEMVFMGALLGYILILILPNRPYRATFLLGLILGISLFIKPHALALVGATLISIILAIYFNLVRSLKKHQLVYLLFILVITMYCVAVILWKLCTHTWTFNPLQFLGLTFYGKYLAEAGNARHGLYKIITMTMYGGAHLSVLALFFFPGLIGIIIAYKQLFKKRQQDFTEMEKNFYLTILFISSMLVTHLFMIAYFTVGASLFNDYEAMRIHGRYLGPVLIFLPFLFFTILQQTQEKLVRPFIVFFIIILAINQWVIFRFFKLFPWDYPTLFGFFTFPNHYQWGFHGDIQIGHWLMLFAFISMGIAWFYKKSFKIIFSSLLIIFLIAGLYQTLNWMRVHSKNRQELSNPAKAISLLLKDNHLGQGVFISDDRDSMTYVLYGLANAPKVISRPPNSHIGEHDVEGADWILFGKPYIADFNYTQAVVENPFTLILRRAELQIISKKETSH